MNAIRPSKPRGPPSPLGSTFQCWLQESARFRIHVASHVYPFMPLINTLSSHLRRVRGHIGAFTRISVRKAYNSIRLKVNRHSARQRQHSYFIKPTCLRTLRRRKAKYYTLHQAIQSSHQHAPLVCRANHSLCSPSWLRRPCTAATHVIAVNIAALDRNCLKAAPKKDSGATVRKCYHSD